MEKMRDSFVRAASQDERRRIAEAAQTLNAQIVTQIPLGEFWNVSATRGQYCQRRDEFDGHRLLGHRQGEPVAQERALAQFLRRSRCGAGISASAVFRRSRRTTGASRTRRSISSWARAVATASL